MEKTVYFLLTFLESILSVFGTRATYEEPRYRVIEHVGNVEIRTYAPRVAVETDTSGRNDGQAFQRLFDYITGANRPKERIAMTAPVETDGARIAMTVPVEQGGEGSSRQMRFYLPASVAADPPVPTDSKVRIVSLPQQTLAVLRFSGSAAQDVRERRETELLDVLGKAGRKPAGEPFYMGYDPPFSIPFLRRNEVAVPVAG